MQNEASVLIDRPIEEVFRMTVDHVPDWSIIVVEDETIEEKNGGGVGTTFRTVTEERGAQMVFDGLVTRHDPPHLHVIEMKGDLFDIEAAYSFDDEGGRTRVTQWSKVHGKGFFGIFLRLFGWAMRKSSCDAIQRELNSLKSFCERQPT